MAREIWQDLRVAARGLARRPGFAALATLTLGLGIGATSAMFGVVHAVVLRPLAYPSAHELVMVWHGIPRLGLDRGPFSYANYAAVRDRTTELSGVAMVAVTQSTLLGHGPPTRLSGARVSGNLFTLLGVDAALGRTIQMADDDPAAEPVVVLSHGLWTRLFGADPGVIGRSVQLGDGEPTVVGVMPPDFPPLRGAEHWLPIALDEEGRARDLNYLQVIARLAPGSTVAAAQADVARILEGAARENPDDRGRTVLVETRHDAVVGGVRAQMYLLLGAVGLALLAACVNVAGLTLTRSANLSRERAVRLALGSGRPRLARGLFAESCVIAAGGGLAGAGVAFGLTRAAAAFAPADLPRRAEIGVEPVALVFLLVITTACVLVFGLLPALDGTRTPPGEVLRETGSRIGGGRRRGQQLLASIQVALALVLMIGGGLLANSLARLQAVELGFDPEGVLTAVMPLRFAEAAERVAFAHQVLARASALPGVERAAFSWSVPFGALWGSTYVMAEGDEVPVDLRPVAQVVPVRGDAFGALGMTLLEGSALSDAVGSEDPALAVVNETLARTLWPEGGAVGRRFRTGNEPDNPWTTVVGVVADTKVTALEDDARLVMYQPMIQAGWIQEAHLVVRASGVDPLSLVAPLRAVAAELDPGLALAGVTTLEASVQASAAQPRLRAWLVGSFGVLVTLLAVLGVYGVTALMVAARVHDIGVRMALGAGRGTVLLDVLRRGARAAGIGIAIGLPAALALARTLEALLYEVTPGDPLTYAGAAALLLAATVLATLPAARRASSVQPMVVLRQD